MTVWREIASFYIFLWKLKVWFSCFVEFDYVFFYHLFLAKFVDLPKL